MPTARRPRPVVPRWISRLGLGGVPEAVAALAVLVVSLSANEPPPTTWSLIADVALALSAGISGRWPQLGGVGAGVALMTIPFVHTGLIPFVLFAMYIPVVSAGVRGHDRLRDLLALWYTAAAFLIAGLRAGSNPSDAILTDIIFVGLMVGAWGVGRSVNRLRRENQRAADLRLASLKDQRRMIARDLHDTVAYATTTMIMRAEEIKLRRSDDAQLVADLEFIINTGRRSVRDLRGMLEALRRNDPAFDIDADASPWRIVSLRDVIAARTSELRSHGIDLGVAVDADLDSLPESVRETLAKLIVEATSNMVKHAGPGPCRMLIEVHDDTLEVAFINRTQPSGGRRSAGSGLGLLGATERVEALGGELEAGEASGTWIMRAQLPIGGE